MQNLITVAIPTYNRPDFLRQSLKSVVDQSYKDIDILVLDNCSTMNIKNVVDGFSDSRIRYVRHGKNLGIIGNWNSAIAECETKYLSIFHDDDVMHSRFIEKSITMLERYQSVGFLYAQANKVDKNLEHISIWSDLHPHEGLVSGYDYLRYTVDEACCVTIAPTVVFVADVFKKVGIFNDSLCFNSFDFNMLIRIAGAFDVYFMKEVLVDYRIHEDQMSEVYWRTQEKAKGRLATMLELYNALCFLHEIAKTRNDQCEIDYIMEKVSYFTKMTSQYARILIKDL